MTPKEKAQQLKESFNNSLTAKDCCLVCVEEMLNVTIGLVDFTDDFEYWKEVKKEIELI